MRHQQQNLTISCQLIYFRFASSSRVAKHSASLLPPAFVLLYYYLMQKQHKLIFMFGYRWLYKCCLTDAAYPPNAPFLTTTTITTSLPTPSVRPPTTTTTTTHIMTTGDCRIHHKHPPLAGKAPTTKPPMTVPSRSFMTAA